MNAAFRPTIIILTMNTNQKTSSFPRTRTFMASGSDEALRALPLIKRASPPGKRPERQTPTPKPATKPARKPKPKTKPKRKPSRKTKPAKPARKAPKPGKRTVTKPARKKTVRKPARKPARKTAKPKAKPSKPLKRRKVKGRLLWIGDAVAPTGFATVTHSMLSHLSRDWEVVVSGVNYEGQPHSHPYRILSARQGHGDMWGLNRFASLCAEFAPDAVVINNDWWNVAAFVQRAPKGLPLVGYMPVDGANLDPDIVPHLSRLAAAVWYTDFGHREAVKAGFRGARHVIAHGIDTARWAPVERTVARDLLELPVPQDAFIVGNVNRNQPRKRLDATIQFFAEWARSRKRRDAWLLLHCAKQDAGWDLERLARHHGIGDRLLLTGGATMNEAADPSRLRLVYNALDAQVSTTLGEGWGLTTMEGMACGIPQVVPDWAALGEWAEPALKTPCPIQLAHPGINTIGALPDKDAFIGALDRLHRDASLRAKLSGEGLAFVRQPQFAWSEVAGQMDRVLDAAIHKRTPQDWRTSSITEHSVR